MKKRLTDDDNHNASLLAPHARLSISCHWPKRSTPTLCPSCQNPPSSGYRILGTFSPLLISILSRTRSVVGRHFRCRPRVLILPSFIAASQPPAGYGSPSSPTSSHSGFSDDESDHLPSPEPDELPKDIDSAGGGDDDDDMNEDEMMMEPVTLAPVAPNGSGIGEKRRLEDDDEEDYDV